MLPFVSLDAANSAGPGAARDLECLRRYHTASVTVTGNPSVDLTLEGSHDGVNWQHLINISSGLSTATEHLVRYIRANITSLSGGSSPTVTVTIASGDE